MQDDEKKIRSKLAENVNLNDYTLYFMVMKQDATMQRKYKGENNQGYVCIDEVNFDKRIFGISARLLIKLIVYRKFPAMGKMIY